MICLRQQGKISPTSLGYFALMVFGAVVLALLQHQYWYGEFGHQNLHALNAQLQKQQRINAEQEETNAVLRADISDLKSGLGAIEEHARLDLGLIKSEETFVQVSDSPKVSSLETAVGVDSNSATEAVDEPLSTP